MNNLQIAIARICTGLTWVLGAFKDLFNGTLAKRWHKNKQAQATMKDHGTNHIECNGTAGRVRGYEEKQVTSVKEDSYMTNPSLNICVPIAPGESDLEFPEEEDDGTEISEDEVNKSVSRIMQTICENYSTLV